MPFSIEIPAQNRINLDKSVTKVVLAVETVSERLTDAIRGLRRAHTSRISHQKPVLDGVNAFDHGCLAIFTYIYSFFKIQTAIAVTEIDFSQKKLGFS